MGAFFSCAPTRQPCSTLHLMDAPNALDELVYTAEELAKLKKLHPSTIRKMFIDEPGVMRLGRGGSRNRKQYYTLRIPASVAARVFSRMTVR